MIKFSVKEVVEQAVQTEKLGYEFYSEMAKRFHVNHELKQLFELLAAHELKHGKRFSDLENSITEETEGWEEATLYLRAIVESEFFLGKDKCLPSLAHVKTPSEAIHFALCFERETLLYYYTLREMVMEKDIVDEIIREEKSHIVWLSNLKKLFV
ncbi:MAG: ferritin family protein [Nitrospirota bacterium]